MAGIVYSSCASNRIPGYVIPRRGHGWTMTARRWYRFIAFKTRFWPTDCLNSKLNYPQENHGIRPQPQEVITSTLDSGLLSRTTYAGHKRPNILSRKPMLLVLTPTRVPHVRAGASLTARSNYPDDGAGASRRTVSYGTDASTHHHHLHSLSARPLCPLPSCSCSCRHVSREPVASSCSSSPTPTPSTYGRYGKRPDASSDFDSSASTTVIT